MAGTREKVEFDPSVDRLEGLGNLCCFTERSEVLRMVKPAGASNVFLGGLGVEFVARWGKRTIQSWL